jgi:hypothetical protein
MHPEPLLQTFALVPCQRLCCAAPRTLAANLRPGAVATGVLSCIHPDAVLQIFGCAVLHPEPLLKTFALVPCQRLCCAAPRTLAANL